MKVRELTVGPILGAVGPNEARIWGRAKPKKRSNGMRRCFGAARIRKSEEQDFGPAHFFKMNPNFDMTGVLVFKDLEPNQSYDYQMGWFFAELEPEDLKSSMMEWRDANTASFTTGVDDKAAERNFVFGSCRYLLRLFGGSFFDSRGDKTYKSILNQLNEGAETHAALMIGDQIYADDLNALAADAALDEFYKRYRDAFSQPYIRELMSRVPTYMTLDDHEIEDNWPTHSSEKDLVLKYPSAMHAYLTYQMSHSPLFETDGHRLSGVPNHFWYSFQDGCCDFFVTDVRTERNLSNDPEEREIINSIQLEALEKWLLDKSGNVKFVVSSVPFFPDARSSSRDKWDGFLKQRSRLIDLIRKKKVKKTVFLSGDIHCSCTSTLTSPDDPEFQIVSIISSSFFWPYPHPKKDKYMLTGKLESYKGSGNYQVNPVSDFIATDNFTRIHATPSGLAINVYSRKGDHLDQCKVSF